MLKSETFEINLEGKDMSVTIWPFGPSPNQFTVTLHEDPGSVEFLGVFVYKNGKWKSNLATPQRLVDTVGNKILQWHQQQGISL